MTTQRRPRKPATIKQVRYIEALARERGLRWAKPFNPELTSSAAASDYISSLLNNFSVRCGTFTREFLTTGLFEVVDQALVDSHDFAAN